MSELDENLTPAERRERDVLAAAFREVFLLPSGKRVLFWMLEQCAIYREAFAGEAVSATHYALGLQGAGRKLIAKLDEIDQRFYPSLLLEIATIKAIDREVATNMRSEDDDVDA
ncbi:hypothetical protein NE852_12920 [Rhizobium sp. Pop5]|uniref:hypothetical protein n=1 Tax=Rhizobium sp. Pop5 TaxID=1223565 RepID=UPI002156FE54|nr:hypothetical protein [Rhizobium sp. Pop5]UVD59028.1 hypothetical protein NE852_12920 [Rhizobium sp. Pop5]